MKILGIGVDIIQNKRIKSLIKNKTFISRTFSLNEIKFSRKLSNKTNYFSKREDSTKVEKKEKLTS